MTNFTTDHLQRLLDQATPGPWEYLTYDYCPDRRVQDECDQIGAEYPENMTFECGCGDEQETCQTQHYITGKADGVIAWNPQFNEVPSTDDMHLAALAPQLAEEVIRLRGEIKGLITAMENKAGVSNGRDTLQELIVAENLMSAADQLRQILLGEHR